MPGAISSRPAIIFDLDGTLVDSVPGITSALAQAFRAVGRVMPPADLRRIIGPPIKVIARHVDPHITDAELIDLEPVYRHRYDSMCWRETMLFPGVSQTIKDLAARGHRLFIATNKPRVPTLNILKHFELISAFEDVITRDSISPHFASKADMLLDLLRRHSLNTNTLMVGDTSEDFEAAHAHQLNFAFAAHGYGSVPSAPLTLHNIADLLTIDLETSNT